MSIIATESRQKINQVINEGQRFADALSHTGLHMDTEINLLHEKEKALNSGLFKTLVMGKLKTGKSTLINALAGKEITATKATACTSMITVIEYGNDLNSVDIVCNDGNDKKITLEQFNKEYQLSHEDYDLWGAGINPDRFANISHAVIQCNNKLFADGLRLIDSPGQELDKTRTEIISRYVPQADAIIFMLDAVSSLSTQEQDYITDNFAGKGLHNLFFVVNRINLVSPSYLIEETIKPYIREKLHSVFIDENGCFDEELYNKRVFYVDAYCGYCARTKTPITFLIGKKKVSVEPDINDSGLPEFEAALHEFLNSENRLYSSFDSFTAFMANCYRKAQNQAELDKVARSQSLTQREANAKSAEMALKSAEENLHCIQRQTRLSASVLTDFLYNELLRFVEEEIPNHFIEYVETNDALMRHLNSLTFMDLAIIRGLRAGNAMQHQYEQLLQPILEEIKVYINKQLNDWAYHMSTPIRNSIESYQNEIEENFNQYTRYLKHAKTVFAYGCAADNEITAAFNFETSIDTSFISNYTQSRNSFILDMVNSIGCACLMEFRPPVLLMGFEFILHTIAAIVQPANALALTNNIGNAAFDRMIEVVKKSRSDFGGNITKQFFEHINPLVETSRNTLNDIISHMEDIMAENAVNQTEAEEKNRLVEENLLRMKNSIDVVHEILYGHKPSDIEFDYL